MNRNRTEIKKWIKSNLSKVNLLCFSIVKTDIYWQIGVGQADNECYMSLISVDAKLGEKYKRGYVSIKSPITSLSSIQFSAHILCMIMAGMDHVNQFDYDAYREWYHIFQAQFDKTYERVVSQVAKVVKSYAYKVARREAQRKLIKAEFNEQFCKWKKDCRLIKQDELYLLISTAMDELKVSEVMEA